MRNILFSVIFFIISLAIGLNYFVEERKQLISARERKFDFQHTENVLRIKNTFQSKEGVISSIIALFKSSEFVSKNEFSHFILMLGEKSENEQFCWISTKSHDKYVFNSNLESLCDNLNLLDRGNIINFRGKKWIMLSGFTGSHKKGQNGVLYYFFPVNELVSTKNHNMKDYSGTILLLNKLTNVPEFILKNNNTDKEIIIKMKSTNIFTFGSFEFNYFSKLFKSAHVNDQFIRVKLLALLISLLGAFVSIFVFMILNRNEKIREEVIKKTALLLKSNMSLEESNIRLVALNDELSQFAYRTSHDLKAPLTTIKGLTKVIKEDLKSGDLDEAYLNITKIGKHVYKLERLVIDIMNMVRSDLSSEGEKDIDLFQLLKNIKEKYQELAKEKNVILKINVPENTHILAQEVRLTHIFENLIINGIKYCDNLKKEKTVEVLFEERADEYLYYIHDNGLGVPDENQEDIFTMFTRFHPKITDGSGLGMAIVKKNIDRLEGEISFESSGSGTKFTIRVPRKIS